jgi:two-component system, NtrC family, response regulator
MKKGRFELADGGTLFLDEIGELSLPLQVKLLRVLQEKGSNGWAASRPISVNIRLIAATNKSLKEEIRKGHFREDLFYRLNVVPIVLPPLSERQEDIRACWRPFHQKYAEERQAQPAGDTCGQGGGALFFDYSWPGNVRELENVIERAMVMCSGQVIGVDDLPKDFKQNVYKDNTFRMEGLPPETSLYETLAHVEKFLIMRALQRAGYVQAHAADLLGIGKSGLNQKLKKFGIKIQTPADSGE